MLFSGGDFPKTLSSILSGEGFDEGDQGNRRFFFFHPAIRNYDDFIRGAVTACYYHKTALHYSRIVAISGRTGMLFSGGDFLKTLSSILSGEGFDESEQGNRRFTFGLPEPPQRRKVVTPDYRFRLLL
jgi:hypothetical protein